MVRIALLLWVLVAGAWPIASGADELTPEKIRDIKALMSIGMPKEAGLAVFSRQIDKALFMIKRQHPELTDASMSVMREEALKIYEAKRDEPGGLTDRLVVIYHRHLSDDDVKQILQFFATPVGQKVKAFLAVREIEALPIVEQWGDEVGREWARAMIEVLMKEATPPPMGGPR
jgi:uncharacterized protein